MIDDYYVYALYRIDGTPFYIGMGKGNRWLQHEKLSRQKKSYKNHIINQILATGIAVPKAKLFNNLPKNQAISIEKELIAKYGRHPDGLLANVSGGGEGILNLTKECLNARREKIAAALRRPEVRAKISAAGKGRKFPPKTDAERKAIGDAVRGFKHTEAARRKIAQASKARKISPITRAKMAATRKKNQRGYGLEMRRKIANANTGRKHSKESSDKKRKAMLGFKHTIATIEKMRIARLNPTAEVRRAISAGTAASWKNEDIRKKRIKAIKETAASPETRRRLVDAAKARWANPQFRDKIAAIWQKKLATD